MSKTTGWGTFCAAAWTVGWATALVFLVTVPWTDANPVKSDGLRACIEIDISINTTTGNITTNSVNIVPLDEEGCEIDPNPDDDECDEDEDEDEDEYEDACDGEETVTPGATTAQTPVGSPSNPIEATPEPPTGTTPEQTTVAESTAST